MRAHLKLFGAPWIQWAGAWRAVTPSKGMAVLLYLAYRGDWVDRAELIYRFWPDASEERARRNLRQLLTKMRRVDFADGLEAEAKRLRWQVDSDVRAFRDALGERRLAQAVELVEGPLLEGFYVREAPEFESWLSLEREELQRAWRGAVLELSGELGATSRADAAAALLERVVRTDPLDEEALRGWVRALHADGRRSEALQAYRSFRGTLWEEMGIEPDEATVAVVEFLERGESLHESLGAVGESADRRALGAGLPAPRNAFVGREAERTEVAALLRDRTCRLVSLVGVGGVGKTRLALQVAHEEADGFAEGAHFVPLESVASADGAVAAIADAVGFVFFGGEERTRQLLEHLQRRELLLVLDNLEHLLGGAELLAELVAAAPRVTLLVTSRQRLGLQSEWVFPVEDLALPEPNAVAAHLVGSAPSVQLFVRRAQQRNRTFALTDENAVDVAEICRLVGGSPLAIELAAAWIGVMSCREIAAVLAKDLNLLESTAPDRAVRQRSLHATFEHSWSLLAEREREALSGLGVFRGGFDREAAAEVAGVTLQLLAALIDKALVIAQVGGRYDLHPLLASYAREKLAADPERERTLQERHAAHHLRQLSRCEADLWGERQAETTQRLAADLANIEAAWEWAPRAVPPSVAAEAAQALARFCDLTGRHHLAIGLIGQTREAWDAAGKDLATMALFTALQAWPTLHLGRVDEAAALAHRALAIAPDQGAEVAVVFALVALGACAMRRGEFVQATGWFERLLAHAQQAGEPRYTAPPLLNLAEVETARGDYTRAAYLADEALALLREAEDPAHIAAGLADAARIRRLRGDVKAALPLLDEAQRLTDRPWLRWHGAEVALELAEACWASGEPEKSETQARRALQIARDAGHSTVAAGTHRLLAATSRAGGHRAVAEGQAREGVRLAWEAGDLPIVLACLASLAELRAEAGDANTARLLTTAVQNHQGSPRYAREQAERLEAQLNRRARPHETAAEASSGRPLHHVVAPLLPDRQ